MNRRGDDELLRIITVRRGAAGGQVRPALPDLIGTRSVLSYFLLGLLAVLLALVFRGLLLAAHVHLNIWWFEGLGLGDVYGRIWSIERNLFLVFTPLTYLLFTIIFFATRALTFRPGADESARSVDSLLTLSVGFFAALIAMLIGHTMASEWQQYLMATHRQSFGLGDPLHHLDVGFYVFTMPWRETLGNYAVGVLLLAGFELALLAGVYTATSPFETMQNDTRRMVAIGSLFGAVLFLYLAWRNFYLNPFELNQPGTVYGGGATFAHASLWWFPIVGVVQIVAALLLLVNTGVRRISLASVAALPVAVSIFAAAGQGIFQKFVVAPNELSAEYQYLGYTLGSTRHAYGMDRWHAREYTPRSLTSSDLTSNPAAVSDARIADTGAFTQVMRQRQENRTYYGFNTADIDRYTVNGKVRQVLLAGRELDYTKLPLEAQTWVNEHIKFTHGYGLTMAPANTVTRDGQPKLWIENVPVQETTTGLPAVIEPRIYFGENTNSWILTNTSTTEFDSSTADQDTSYRYHGPDGVTVSGGLKRLTLAWLQEGGFPFFDKLNISNYVKPATRLLLRRNIYDRVQTLAPWLQIDSNPYLVLRTNGTLVWMMDGMTTSDHYPYSDPTNGVNYMRNSVKIALDAYTGRPTLYAFDPTDPILRAWSTVFPGLLHPFSEMPPDLRAHIKYPDDYLNWQAAAYGRYHVTDVTSYYNGDNQWDIEQASTYDWNIDDAPQATLNPIWTVARLFGEKHDSFYSILPFSVHGKNTMAGYLAADNNTYTVNALDMPRGAQTMGVTQFESLYNQAPAISSALTLLDQRGSQVVPGQMIILPVGKSLLYIKPLYLRSASSQTLPQLVRVVVGTQNEVNWGYGLRDALNNLQTQGDISNVSPSGTTTAQPTPAPTTGPGAPPATGAYTTLSDARLIALADQYYSAAQRTPSLSQKDQDLKQVGTILRVLMNRHPK